MVATITIGHCTVYISDPNAEIVEDVVDAFVAFAFVSLTGRVSHVSHIRVCLNTYKYRRN